MCDREKRRVCECGVGKRVLVISEWSVIYLLGLTTLRVLASSQFLRYWC